MVVIESPKEVDLAAAEGANVEVVQGGVAEQLPAPPQPPAPEPAAGEKRKEKKQKKKKDAEEGQEDKREEKKGKGSKDSKGRRERRKSEAGAAAGAENTEGQAAVGGRPAEAEAASSSSATAAAVPGSAAASALVAPAAEATEERGAAEQRSSPEAGTAAAALGEANGAAAKGTRKKAPPARNGVPKPGPKITAESGITMDMMRVALAAWDGKEQGPKEKEEGDNSPPTRRKGKGSSGKGKGGDEAEEDADADLEAGSPSAASTSSSAAAMLDPQATRPIFSARFNQAVVLLNMGLGLAYLCWRVFRSMNPKQDWRVWAPVGAFFVDPDDPEKAWSVLEELRWNWFSWLLFVAEVFLMLTIWLGHASRCFPVKRTRCTMDDLVDVDFDVSKRTQVCMVMPTRGEPLNVLREAVLHCMSLNLWPGKLDVRRNARLVVVDGRRRAEVLLLLALSYRFAALFCNNRKVRTQLKLEGRSDMTLAAFYEHYLACTAGFGKTYSDSFTDIFAIADMIHKLCKEDCIPSEWDGLELPSGRRVEPQLLHAQDLNAKVPRLREDFDDVRSILSLVYFSRPSSDFPTASPVAGMLNGLLFPEDPADHNVLGQHARFLVVNDPRHALQTEYLQRTMPYFFRPKRDEKTGAVRYEECPDVAFVQVPLRVRACKDKDPLGNRDLLLNDIIAVGRDGVGGAMAKRHGCMYRVDVLRSGKDAQGNVVVPEEEVKKHVGKGVGFSTLARCEWLPTSIELFRRGYRSVYVNEMGETLSSCFDETTRLHVRVQELFDVHHTATEVLFSDPLGLLKARYTTGRHRLFIIEDLWQGLFTAISVELLILCIALYCYLWRPPLYTHNVEVLFFFLPYYFTAALPTSVALFWKRTKADPAFRSMQVAFATAFIPFKAYFGGILAEISRVVCSRSGRRQFTVESCATWPLYATLVLMVASLVVTFINWARAKFHHPGLWLTTTVVAGCAIGALLPTAMRGIKFQGIPSFYLRYLGLGAILVVVACWQGAAPQPNPVPTK